MIIIIIIIIISSSSSRAQVEGDVDGDRAVEAVDPGILARCQGLGVLG